jgi:hypothetical protein
MSKPNFDAMSRNELANYMVAHRDTCLRNRFQRPIEFAAGKTLQI